jgi:hypothetical protein
VNDSHEKPSRAVDLLFAQLTEDERANAVVYLDYEVRPAGASIVGGVEISSGSSYRLAFIDKRPGSNWMHPSRYLAVDDLTGTVISAEADRPPVFGVLPPSWHVVWRADGVEDWKLLPLAGKPS